MRKIILMTFCIAICGICQAQIVYDFSKRTDLDATQLKNQIKPVRNGDFMIFKIENINTFRYKVEIEGRNIDYATPIPSELQTLFRLPKEEVSQEVKYAQDGASTTGAQGNLMVQVQGASGKTLKEKEELLEQARNAVAGPVAAIAAGTLDTTNLKTEIALLKDFNETMKELVDVCEEYTRLFVKVADIKFTRMLLINASKQKWNKHSEMLDALPPYKSEQSMKNDYLKFVKLYAEVENLYADALLKAKKVKNSKADQERIETATENIEDAYHAVEDDAFLSLIEDVITLQRALGNKNYFEVVSPPIQMDGDFIEFTVNVTPTRVNDLMPYEQATEFRMEVPGKGGWRADFSVGPTLSFGDGAKNEHYIFERNVLVDGSGTPNGIDSVGTLSKVVESDAVRPGIAAMIHAYKRSGKQFNWGMMLGVGAGFESVSDANFSLYLGPTFVFGKRQKFMLSGGLSYHAVDRLNEEFELNTNYPADQIDEANLTEKYIKPSWFISLSYALGTRVEVN